MDDYLRSTEKELAQAGIRAQAGAGVYFVRVPFVFLLTVMGGMFYLQRRELDHARSSAD